MNVLVVDDQTSVVSGIVSGVDWRTLGVAQVWKAYNAYEAKEILLRERVDILLCDIEMPVESGLDLFRWLRKQELAAECIFLTAHADFLYVKEAIQLGGFDYILQPARYKDIEQAIARAAKKIQGKQEMQKYYNYGKMLYHDKPRLLEGYVRNWFIDRDIRQETLMDDFSRIGLAQHPAGQLYLVLFCIAKAQPDQGGLKELLRREAPGLFVHYGQKVLITELSRKSCGMLIYPENRFAMDPPGVVRQLERLQPAVLGDLGEEIACYAGAASGWEQISACVLRLEAARKNNVALTGGVFFVDGENETDKVQAELPNMKIWGCLLLNGGAAAVYEQSIQNLDGLSAAGQLTAQLLKRFYQEFMQMLYLVVEQMDRSVKEIFPDDELLDIALTPYTSMEEMNYFLHYVISFFDTLPAAGGKNKNQVEQMIQYIRSNLDKDIRRTDIAEAVFLNPSYISRLFRSETGMSLKEFITEEKMKMAQALLRTTELPISMVAVKLGYSNFSHFSQVYRKVHGVSPAEDRKQ